VSETWNTIILVIFAWKFIGFTIFHKFGTFLSPARIMKDIYVYMSKEAESRACNPCFRSSHFQSVLLGLWHYCGDFGWSPGGLGWFLDEIRIFLISGSWGHGFLQNLSSIIAPHYKKMQQASEFWTCCTIRHFLGLFSAIRPPPPSKKKFILFFENMDLPFEGQIMDQFSPNLYHKRLDHLTVPYHIFLFPLKKASVIPKGGG